MRVDLADLASAHSCAEGFDVCCFFVASGVASCVPREGLEAGAGLPLEGEETCGHSEGREGQRSRPHG